MYGQLLFAILVFGLSVDISKELCDVGACGTANSRTTGLTAWVGGIGIIVDVVGLLTLFWERIRPTVTLILDGLAASLFLAGGLMSRFLSIFCGSLVPVSVH